MRSLVGVAPPLQLPILVGEAPGPKTARNCPLLDYPPRSAGARLRDLMGMSSREYQRSFHRVNLVDAYHPVWTAAVREQARVAGVAVRQMAYHGVVIAVGAKVAEALGVGDLDWFKHRVDAEFRCIIHKIPHPSGRNRVYNDPEMGRRLREMIEVMR